ncbi:hypothetical protein C1I98_13540 [Spongiactinospora gelatinilytica]|uniref:Uncharacterized protein n=1 Tax=Spongiactinospora gelatinilytica TaxID=2666298 RepID=A0A2W2GFT5_9ACTN|nr:type I polyketide synthase [Spongiactinospora gelatinilytica]PZG47441.1 hypothetical protein C1I98_13540 [Spongiactinospora gelatinilytica]
MPENVDAHDIAVIGTACRFPGATGTAEFWRMLRSGTEPVTVFTDAELAAAGAPAHLIESPDYVPAAGVVADSDAFDAGLFALNPKEATLMDPQHRVMLECAWEALEDSGHDPKSPPGRVGVFAGAYKNAYRGLLGTFTEPAEAFLAGVSTDDDYLATRISFKLNLNGPSVTVQTACSTALVAVHMACESLQNGSSDLALAGGVTIRSGEVPGYRYHKGGIYSPDGHCRAFDADAEGTVIGEGAGIVVLKRLSDALADGDRIRAVIKGSAMGNDGAERVGFSAPGVAGQSRIVEAALRRAAVHPDSIGYVETHGSGTPLGDRIEIDALTRAYRAAGWTAGSRLIGSVKTNIGHTHAAAGIAGLIKAILSLENREIPPSLHFDRPNPRIRFAESPFRVAAARTEWAADGPRRAGVSSFGMGGTGVHVILEEAPEPSAPTETADGWQVLPLAAAGPEALESATDRLADHLEDHPEVPLDQVARTLQTGRHAFPHRRALAVRDRDDAVAALRDRTPQRVLTFTVPATERKVAFLLPGLGEQYEHMGAELYERDPVFREHLDHCFAVLLERAGLDLRPVLFPPHRQRATGGGSGKVDLRALLGRADTASALDQTRYAQPAMFVVEYALARTWAARGITPDGLLGYSLGEFVAATLAGVFTLSDALWLVAERAKLIDELPGGAMLAVQLPEPEVAALLGPEVSLAAVNGRDLCVLAGPPGAITEVRERLKADGVAARRLRTTHAFHSVMMDPITDRFTELVAAVPRNRPARRYLSNVTGDWITDAEAQDPAYYARHLRHTVRFWDGVRRLWEEPGRLLLEVGVGQSLGSLALQSRPRTADAGSLVLGSLPGSGDTVSDAQSIAATTAKLWVCGVDTDWDGVQPQRRKAELPTYPFQRRRYWPAGGPAVRQSGPAEPDGGRRKPADWFYTPHWESLPPAPPLAATGQRWLLFADAAGVGERLAGLLAERGATPVLVRPGDAFAELPDKSFTVDPADATHYAALLRALESGGGVPARIAHLWLTGPRPADPFAAEAVEAATRDGLTGLIALAQALGGIRLTEPVEVTVVSSEMHAIVPGDDAQPAKALALGPVRVWPLENPSITCRSIDLAEPGPASAEALLRELGRGVAAGTGAEVVAIRGRLHLRQTFRPADLEGPGDGPQFRQGGTYLITGGLGGIGLSVAAHLAEQYQANLVLVGRTPLPPRAEWDALATGSERIRALLGLEERGGTVLFATADVTDAAQVTDVVRQAVERFGALHGVVHAAGVPGGGLIQLKDPAAAAKVLAPKVAGALALRAACAGQPLDFVLHCSSGIAVTGGVGQVDYAAANSFLDALAHREPETVSVNWDAWRDIGMAAKSIAPATRPVDHPFLERRLGDDRLSVYVAHFHPERSWLVDEHRMLGRPVVPGVGHLELVRAAYAHAAGHTGQGVELTGVTFYTPIVVPDAAAKEVRVVLERTPDGTTFSVVSAHDDGSAAPRWQLHSTGRVGELTGERPPRLDVEAARAGMRDLGRPDGTGPMGFGARSQCLSRMYAGDGRFLARLDLAAPYRGEVGDLPLHPALMDIATAFVGVHHAEEFRIPIHYGRLRMFAPLTASLYSFQEYLDGDRARKETVTSDVTITDEDGNVLVHADRFVLKRVHDLDDRLRVAHDATPGRVELCDLPPLPDEDRPESTGFLRAALDHGMSAEEGTAAFVKILTSGAAPQVMVSTRALDAVLREAAANRAAPDATERREDAATGALHPRPALLVPYEAPRDALEESLAEVWQELLGVEKVGVHDNFFELGGHSLLGLQLAPRLREGFGVDLPIGTIFDALTVAGLADVLRTAGAVANT